MLELITTGVTRRRVPTKGNRELRRRQGLDRHRWEWRREGRCTNCNNFSVPVIQAG